MVSTRLANRSEPETTTRASRSKAAATRTRTSSSSSARASRTLPSDENAPHARRVLGDIQNVAAQSKAAVGTRPSSRKPLSDRNANIRTAADFAPYEDAKARSARSKARTSRDDDAEYQKASMMPAQSSRKAAQPAPVPAPKVAAGSGSRQAEAPQAQRSQQTSSNVKIDTRSSSEANEEEDPLSSQIQAADRRARNTVPSHDELARLSPGLDSDDLGYFDVSTLQQQHQPAQVESKPTKRSYVPESEDTGSYVDASASQGSFGSSDKENVPPPAARSRTRTSNLTTTRARAGVLGAIEESQPTHSTPIASERAATKGKAAKSTYLDDIFLDESDHSSQADSPGVARRAEPLSASAQQLLDYQERGVSKVMAWKAAGHDDAQRIRHDTPFSDKDGSSAASWPSRVDLETAADEHDRSTNDDDMDDFGFFTAEHTMRARRAKARAQSSEDPEPLEDDHDDVFMDLHTEAPVNTTSDDRRLAEQAFGPMSSPAGHRRTSSSPTAEPSSVVFMEGHRLEAAQRSEASEDKDDQVEVKAELDGSKRVTRGSTKRKSDAAAANEAEEDDSAPSDLSLDLPPRKGSTRATKARKSSSGIQLKKTEKKEQAVLKKLAAEDLSSPTDSDASYSYSPRAEKKTKKKAESPAAKMFRMDDALGLLPPRKRNTPNVKAKGSLSKKKKTTATTNRKGKAASGTSTRASTSRSSSKGKTTTTKARAARDDDEEEDDDDVDDDDESFEEKPTKSKAKRATTSKAKAKAKKGKARSEPDSSDEDRWMQEVTSSQIHSDDSARTRRLKEIRAAEKYTMEVEDVI